LYLYGGEFSDDPVTPPVPYSMWSYDIASSTWNQAQNLQTSAGDDSDGGGQPVQSAAEGAGLTVPSLGRGYYFGGHLDVHTTAGWPISVARVYLTSLLEFTFPGRSNPSVSDNNQAAGPLGLYRNITQGGLQDTASFPERADGVLVYVPGFGADGIILGLAGGNNDTFTQMNIIDVFDIANSTWYKQATSGPTPQIRVNPCAVAQSAPDGSSIQVYMYGGQNLVPAGSQIQYDDIWILTLPSFTWIKVDTTNQSVPPARAGHTCDSWNAQMVVVGGYVGTQLECDTPGIYVFNLSSLTWQNTYAVLEGANNLNQQKSQEKDPSAMGGTYGYEVPAVVRSVIGGSALGGATVTAPALTATAGPFATGSPITYTVTGTGGATVTETSSPRPGSGGSGSSGSNNSSKGTNVGAIVAGVIACILGILAAYLGFCTWVYRRQLHLYKNHVAMAQRAHLGTPGVVGAGILAPGARQSGPPSARKSSFDSRSHNSGEASGSASGNGSGRGNSRPAYQQLASNNPYSPQVYGNASTANSSTEDLMSGQEPSFLGVFLNPRRSLRVVNRD
jgi:Kelch motif